MEIDRLSRAAQPDAARKERPPVLERGRRHRAVGTQPRKARLSSEFEDVEIAQEEVALLRKEQVEPREVDLPVVHLGRREIGVDRQGGVQRRRDLVKQVERRLRIAPAHVQRRHDVKAEALLQTGKADGRAADARVHAAIPRDPGHALVLPRDDAKEVQPPRVVVRIERERLERNGHLGHPAALVLRRLGVVDSVPIELALRGVLVQPVDAHAVRADDEDIAGAAVVEGVEDDREVIVAREELSLPQDVRADAVRIAVP